MPFLNITRVLNVVSEPTRLRILIALSVRKMCVCEICAALDLGQVVASQHLRVLRDCGLVIHRKNGLWVDYELSKAVISGSLGRVVKPILLEAGKDESIRKDRNTAAKVDRHKLCGNPSKRKRNIACA